MSAVPGSASAALAIERVALDSLHLDPANARAHGDRNLDSIADSLKRFGQTEPLIVQASSGRVIGGNGRLSVMRKLGWAECDVVRLEISDLEATALGIALNRTAERAEWDGGTLGRLLAELRDEGALDGVGFEAGEIDELLAELDVEPQELEDHGPGEGAYGADGACVVSHTGHPDMYCGSQSNSQCHQAISPRHESEDWGATPSSLAHLASTMQGQS